MRFLPKLLDFLNQHGTIYTVRRYKYLTTEVYVEGVGRCKLSLIRCVSNRDELAYYVVGSGFDSVDEWWAAIRKFIPMRGADMWLFKVVVKK